MSATIHEGDCLDVMAGMEAGSVTAVLTDPPYGLSFMGKGWDHGVPGAPFWSQAFRLLKPGGMLFAFGGTRTYHRLACAIEDAGFELRDCMAWLYGSGFPKSRNIGLAVDALEQHGKTNSRALRLALDGRKVVGSKMGQPGRSAGQRPGSVFGATHAPSGRFGGGESLENMRARVGESLASGGHRRDADITAPNTPSAQLWHGYGTALKPAWEPIIVAMRPTDGTFAANALAHGVAGLNVDGGRIETDDATRKSAPEKGSAPVSAYGAGINGGGCESIDGLGRWPANVALDEGAARLLDEQSGERGGGYGARGSGATDGRTSYAMPGQGQTVGFGDSGGASRFFYTAKASSADRHADGDVLNTHPTVKPTDLMQWLARLVKMPSGTRILDPFAGSGSTLLAAVREGCEAIGIEREPEYVEIARKRIVADAPMFNTCEVIR